MLIKATIIFDIQPVVTDFVKDNLQDTMKNCIGGFLECSKCQCECQDDKCINAECQGCKSFTVVDVERIKKRGETACYQSRNY